MMIPGELGNELLKRIKEELGFNPIIIGPRLESRAYRGHHAIVNILIKSDLEIDVSGGYFEVILYQMNKKDKKVSKVVINNFIAEHISMGIKRDQNV